MNHKGRNEYILKKINQYKLDLAYKIMNKMEVLKNKKVKILLVFLLHCYTVVFCTENVFSYDEQSKDIFSSISPLISDIDKLDETTTDSIFSARDDFGKCFQYKV